MDVLLNWAGDRLGIGPRNQQNVHFDRPSPSRRWRRRRPRARTPRRRPSPRCGAAQPRLTAPPIAIAPPSNQLTLTSFRSIIGV
jgi:hypothetical protein